jgi:fumarate hydratase class I
VEAGILPASVLREPLCSAGFRPAGSGDFRVARQTAGWKAHRTRSLERLRYATKAVHDLRQGCRLTFDASARYGLGVIQLVPPFTEQKIRGLKVGDEVSISAVLFTGRDAVHKHLHEGGDLPPEVHLRDGLLYHCGPVVIKDEQGRWKVTAAGPTTSIREEPYQGDIIRKFGLRGVIGKGGMGERTLAACKEAGCVYLHAVGGAAQVLAECIKAVRGVYLLEKFGAPEAIWEIEVERFPAVVTMDAHGNSLHQEIFASSQAKLRKLF